MMRSCTICLRQLTDADTGRYACRGCEHHLAYVLRQLPAEALLLHDRLAPYRSPSTGTRFGGRAHPPLPVDARVLDLLATTWVPDPHGDDSDGIPIGPALVGWACMVAREHPYAERRAGTVYLGRGCDPIPRAQGGIPGWARWLRLYLPVAVTHPWIEQMHEDLDGVLRRVRAITGTRPRTRSRLAPCPACAAFGLAATDGVYEIVCSVCGHRMDPDAYAAHAEKVLPALTTIAVLTVARDLAGPQDHTGLEAAG